MIKILFVSENREQIEKFDGMFAKSIYEYISMSDSSMFFDTLKVTLPDIVFIDANLHNV